MSAIGSSPTIATSLGSRRSTPRSAARPANACSNTTGDGLPQTIGRPAGRDLEARDERTRVERLATRRQPPRVAVHRHELRAAPDRPERDVHVAVAELVAAVADDDRGELTRRGSVGLVRRHERLAVELAERIGGARSRRVGRPGWCAAVYAAAAEAAVMNWSPGTHRPPNRADSVSR